MPSEPKPDPRTHSPLSPGPEGGTLWLHRISHYRDTLRSYHVLFDGQRVGTIRDGATEEFTVAPGTYEVRLQLMWLFSPPLEVTIGIGTETHLTCGPNGGIAKWWTLLLSPRSTIFCRPTADGDAELRDRQGWWRPQERETGT